jgi:aminobenzoyl-glutamate transport protein
MGLADRVLSTVERAGNRLPDPATLFVALAAATLALSAVGEAAGWSVVHPGDGSTVPVVSLLNAAGVRRMLTEAVTVFTGFPPLGVVLVMLLGIGVAEASGLFGAVLRALVAAVPARWMTAAMVFAGVNASLAADAGFLVLLPLAAAVFVGAGRHPLAGLALAYGAISGGFSANLLITGLDPLLAGLTTSAARLVDPDYTVDPTANWYLMIAGVFLLTAVGAWVNDHVVEPRLGTWTPPPGFAAEPVVEAAAEARGLKAAAAAVVVVGAAALALTLPEGAALRDADGGTGPLFKALVPLLAAAFFAAGVAFGAATGAIRSDKDVVAMASGALGQMGSYLVLAFCAAQFLAWFNWSNLGIVLAVRGADGLVALGLGGAPLLAGFVLLSASINLMIASASAKWAVIGPIFVPMLMLLGFSPEVVQAAYRVGDSCTNPVSPLMPYLPVALVFARKYTPELGVGTLLSLLLPYSAAFVLTWLPLLIGWVALGWPLGPGAPLTWAP